MYELLAVLAEVQAPTGTDGDPRSEAYVASDCRVVGGRIGLLSWRNNVGVLEDVNGRPVRYGLANETPQMNKTVKSGDDIGILSHVVTPEDIGRKFGIFVSIEHKKADWRYSGTGREPAQANWQQVINGAGGIALFATKGQDIIDRLVNDRLLSFDYFTGQPT